MGYVNLPGEYGEAQRRSIEMAETLISDLERNSGNEKLLREARSVLRKLQAPRPTRRVPKSEEVLRHQASQIRLAVSVADATDELTGRETGT